VRSANRRWHLTWKGESLLSLQLLLLLLLLAIHAELSGPAFCLVLLPPVPVLLSVLLVVIPLLAMRAGLSGPAFCLVLLPPVPMQLSVLLVAVPLLRMLLLLLATHAELPVPAFWLMLLTCVA